MTFMMTCINNEGFEHRLTHGKTYDVENTKGTRQPVLFLHDDKGDFMEASMDKFKEMPQEEPKKKKR